jgi:enoyl-CoA hydratase/carnithine racemase
MTTDKWDHIYKDAKHLLMNLLDIEVPVIAAVNGPALIHAEIPVLSDIVICSENAEFQGRATFPERRGSRRGRARRLAVGARRESRPLFPADRAEAFPCEALTLGVVSETVSRDKLLPRAWNWRSKSRNGRSLRAAMHASHGPNLSSGQC